MGAALFAAALTGRGIAAAELPAAIAAARVRDANASFFDVPARRAAVQRGNDARLAAAMPRPVDCAKALEARAPAGPMAIPPYYLSGGHGPVNPDHAAAERPYRQLEQNAAQLAGSYAARGRAEDAQCLIELALSWAEAGALLDYDPRKQSQSWYTVEWAAASLGLALSIVRGEPGLDAAKRDRVSAWLRRVVTKQIGHGGGATSCCNNHYYWRGLQAAAAGVVIPDDDLFRWGLASWWHALGHLAPDGSFPLEMARHERAIAYQNFALGPLIMTAELAARQGIDLHALGRNDRTMHDAVAFLAAAIDDPKRVTRHAAEPQYLKPVEPGSGDLAWMEFYHRRFPDRGLDRFLDRPLFNRRLGGAATFFAAPRRRGGAVTMEARADYAGARSTQAICGATHALHDGFGSGVLLFLPLWQSELGLSLTATGALRAMYSIANSALQFPVSLVAERLSERAVLALGTAVLGIGFIGAAVSGSYALLAAAILLTGVGASAQHPLSSSLITRTARGTGLRMAVSAIISWAMSARWRCRRWPPRSSRSPAGATPWPCSARSR